MQTKIQFFRDNIIISIIVSLYLIFIIGIPLRHIILNPLYYWGTLLFLFLYFIIHLLNDWYIDYRFKELEKQINDLKNNQNKF